ncbi:hypothetical protein SFRURICE_019468, partial [Spodoptera frugiperda]
VTYQEHSYTYKLDEVGSVEGSTPAHNNVFLTENKKKAINSDKHTAHLCTVCGGKNTSNYKSPCTAVHTITETKRLNVIHASLGTIIMTPSAPDEARRIVRVFLTKNYLVPLLPFQRAP